MSFAVATLHLSFFSSLGLLSASFAVYWILWIIYARTFHPLSKVPGPWLASVSRTWYMIQIVRGDMEHTQRRLHAQHGPLIRIAPNEVACAAPDAIRKIYRTGKDALDKTDFYPVWSNPSFSKYPDHFTGVKDRVHAERRRIVNHVYSLSNVLQSERYIDRCSQLFLQRMGEYADGARSFDLGTWLQWYAFDVIGELYFGRMFGFMEKRHDHGGWIYALELLTPFLCVTAVGPSYLRPLILGSAIVVPGSLRALKAIDTIAEAAKSCVAKRFDASDETEKRTDLLEQLYSIYREKGEKVDFKMGEIELEAYVGLFAGSDTTAIAFRAVFYFLMKHPAVYDELLREIDHAAETGQLSFPVKYSDAIKLPYLCACIKEAFRMHPSVALTMGRIVPPEGMELCGVYIPGGYRVGMNGAVVHYDRSIFGDDADQFRPGRWLEGDATEMEKHMLIFGAGTRTCIGKNISLAELHKLVPHVLRHYRLELWEDGKQWHTINTWFNKQEGVEVRITRRKVAC